MPKVALVTGGDRGIGRDIVPTLLAQGWTVATTCLPGIVAADAENPNQTLHPLDLREPDSIHTCLDAVVARHGAIAALVNNAAVGSATLAGFANTEAAQDAAMMAINAVGTLTMCRGFVKNAGPQQGARKLVNI